MTPTLRRTPRSGAVTAATTVLTALAVLLFGPGVATAQAHSELTSSTPSAKARLSTAPATVTLVFSDAVEPRFTNVALTIGNTKPVALKGKLKGPTVTAPIPTQQQATGVWKVSYRVVSADGHPISGTISFTVTSESTPARTPATPATTKTPTAASATDTSRPVSPPAAASGDRIDRTLLLWLAAIIALMAALAYAVWRSGKSNL